VSRCGTALTLPQHDMWVAVYVCVCVHVSWQVDLQVAAVITYYDCWPSAHRLRDGSPYGFRPQLPQKALPALALAVCCPWRIDASTCCLYCALQNGTHACLSCCCCCRQQVQGVLPCCVAQLGQQVATHRRRAGSLPATLTVHAGRFVLSGLL
jgi:hypothetical protein